jgi:hypothetical protein
MNGNSSEKAYLLRVPTVMHLSNIMKLSGQDHGKQSAPIVAQPWN